MNDVKKFFRVLATNPRGKELAAAAKVPDNAEEAVEMYLGIAKELGVSVSRENILEFVRQKEKLQLAASAKAEASVKEALDEAVLDSVAGGAADTQCQDSFDAGEWCWFTDSCAVLITSYEGNYASTNDQYGCSSEAESLSQRDVLAGDSTDFWESWTKECLGGLYDI